MRTNIVIFLVGVFAATETVYGWKHFHHGRSRGGNLGAPAGDELLGIETVSTEWFQQHLDHFNPNDNRTWKQRYFVNDGYVSSNRDVAFLMIGGEGEASIRWMTSGAWMDTAKEYKAICFQLEHRYYGQSHPTPDLSTDNLQYLTSQQALADLAYFIAAMNVKYELAPNVKWIAFGGSYPGSLAAWLRQKYPHLVHGAMSASGPLLAQVNFPEYFTVVYDDLRAYGEGDGRGERCVAAVKQAFYQVSVLMQRPLGERNLDEKFKLCDSVADTVKDSKSVANLFDSLTGLFAEVAQYNRDNRLGNNITTDMLCDMMLDQKTGPEVDRLAAINDLMLNRNNESCLDYKYEKMLADMRNVSWESSASEGGRQWFYQTCTEFGFYQTTDAKPQIFGDRVSLDFFVQQCKDIFGPRYTPAFLNDAVTRTNILYGALDIQASNVVFVHGSFDPWHVLGLYKTKENDAPAIYIKGAAHCANMYPPSDNDTPQLKAARVQIQETIGTWLDL